MNTNKKFDLYKKFLSTQPISAIRVDLKEMDFYRIKMKYEINKKYLILNAFANKEKTSYGANIMNDKNKVIAKFNNMFFAQKLYEHGQKYL